MFYHGSTVLLYPVYRTSFLGKTPYYGYTWLKIITNIHFKYKKFIQKIQFCLRTNLGFYCFYSVKEYLSSSFRTLKQSSDLAACAFFFLCEVDNFFAFTSCLYCYILYCYTSCRVEFSSFVYLRQVFASVLVIVRHVRHPFNKI